MGNNSLCESLSPLLSEYHPQAAEGQIRTNSPERLVITVSKPASATTASGHDLSSGLNISHCWLCISSLTCLSFSHRSSENAYT